MAAFNTTVGHPTTIRRQYMPLATMYYRQPPPQATDQYSPEAALRQSRGEQMVKNQTMLVGGVYHW